LSQKICAVTLPFFGGTEEKPGDLGIGFGLTERECHKGAGLFVQIVANVQNDGT
jgi:hypothetical protein